MTTEQQIALAIQQSVSKESEEDEDEMFQTDNKARTEPSHQRMTTAEQITHAIMMSQGGGDSAAELPVPAKGHRRMTTEERIANAISETVVEEVRESKQLS